ncbi:SH3-like domain-containing protein [Elusimicrobium posterum]|uniref:SH3 domain-containing protein n=1 Tax=Elusimicrobium posterum TaxID=3116653 RepID=UPI003C78174A
MKKLLTAALLLSFTAVPSFAARYATVKVTEANIRSCAGASCSVKWKAWKYTPLDMRSVSKDKQWVQVKDFEGHTGWIYYTSLSTDMGLSATVDLNVRKTASSKGELACTVEKGYAFKYLGKKSNGWYQVQDDPANKSEGVCTGWVYGANLWGPRVKAAK